MTTKKGDPKVSPNETVNRAMLDEAVDTLLKGMDKLFERFKSETDNISGEMNSFRSDVSTRLDNLEAKVNQMKIELTDEIDGLKADLSNTPSRREFEELKTQVNKRYPLS